MMSNVLFNKITWFDVHRNQLKLLSEDVAGINADRLLNTSVEDLCDYFEKKYCIDVPILRLGEIEVDPHEKQIDVRGNPHYFVYGNRPSFVTGTAVEVIIPFDGEAGAFEIEPSISSFSPPRGDVRDGVLTLWIEGTNLTAEQVGNDINRNLEQVQKLLSNLRTNVQELNGKLRNIARTKIEQRRQKLLADRNLVAGLGFKVKEREGSPHTYVAPEIRRKLTPVLPPASTSPFKPEPTLSGPDYEHILSVIQNMAEVMERSPSAFRTIDEEALRSHFLVQLNGHYEGQATGETFNYEGKTDILIRSEGKNIFIAECKYWSGPKMLIETIDQLLGYSSWRDTKVAVIIFNRNKGFSKVLETIPHTVKEHPNYKRESGQQGETVFKYIFAHKDDPNREMILTVLAFDVPS